MRPTKKPKFGSKCQKYEIFRKSYSVKGIRFQIEFCMKISKTETFELEIPDFSRKMKILNKKFVPKKLTKMSIIKDLEISFLDLMSCNFI